MKSKPKVTVAKEREVRTYAEVWHTSNVLLQKGNKDPEGSVHQFRASMVFMAFTVEAYLNHVGPKMFKCWNDLERLTSQQKLNVIGERLRVDIDYVERPWQVMKHLFGFRNAIAHGRSKVIKSEESLPLNEYSDEHFWGDRIRTDWEKYFTQENAQKASEDVEKIIHTLYERFLKEFAGLELEYPFTFGIQSCNAWIKKKQGVWATMETGSKLTEVAPFKQS